MPRTVSRLRVLLIAEAANPEWVSVPLEGWSHARALQALVDGHLVTQVRNAPAIERAGLGRAEFTAIDSERLAAPIHRVGRALRGGSNKGWTTVSALNSLAYYYFEHLVWKRFGGDIQAGRYDVVHRLTPLSPTTPSLIAGRCARAGVPFVLGPLNGGVPWPRGYETVRRSEKERLSPVRDAHRLLPGYRGTRRHAAAIVAGSLDALAQVPARYRSKCVYIAENAIDPDRFTRPRSEPAARPLRVAFVGRLVPYKGADMLLEAASPFLRAGTLTLDIIGDGPQLPHLRAQAQALGVSAAVRLDGWVEHRVLQDRLVQSSVFALPSIREFGGGAVLEAMVLGLLPIVVDYGGPGELVTDETGIRIPMAPRAGVVSAFRSALGALVEHPESIGPRAARARERVLRLFTWDVKAQQTLEVYRWVTGARATRPDFGLVAPQALEATFAAP